MYQLCLLIISSILLFIILALFLIFLFPCQPIMISEHKPQPYPTLTTSLSLSTSTSASRSQQIQYQNQIGIETQWGRRFGFQIDQQCIKKMHKQSILIPAPLRTQQRNRKKFKEIVYQQKWKLSSIFRRIKAQNSYQYRLFTQNAQNMSKSIINNINKCHLPEQQCDKFLTHFQNEINKKYKCSIKTIKSLMNDGLYQKMEMILNQTNVWIIKVQKKVNEQYKQKIENNRRIENKKQCYGEYVNLYKNKCVNKYQNKPSINFVNESDKNTTNKSKVHNQQDEMVFNMKQLQDQILRLVQKEKQETQASVEQLCKKLERSQIKVKSNKRHSSGSQNQEDQKKQKKRDQ